MEKLLEVVIDSVWDFVTVIVRATVIFYVLDVRSGETTEVCLHNLLTSLTLKNPVYAKLLDLFKAAYRDSMKQIEQQIEGLRDRRNYLQRLYGVNEVQIGQIISERAAKVQEESRQHYFQFSNSNQQQRLAEVKEEESSSCSDAY